MAGLDIVGRAHFGVFPLRGKPLNVRDAPRQKVEANTELHHLVAALGLRHGQSYAEPRERARLRYGHLMLMTDQARRAVAVAPFSPV